MTFPEMVKKTRTDAHLSQGAFARHLGVSRATINRWEQGTQAPSALAIHTFEDYCTENGVNISRLTVKSVLLGRKHDSF